MAASRPSATSFTLNFEEAVRAMFKDPDWVQKLLLASLFSFLGIFIIGGIILQGYLLAYAERVSRAEPRPLPEWDDYGELLRKGFIGMVVALVYALPIVVVAVVLTLLMIPIIAASSAGGANADTIAGIGTLAICGGMAIAIPFLYLIMALVPAAHIQLILHDYELGSAFRLGEVFGLIRRNLGQYILMTVLYFAALMFLSQIGQLACLIGIYPATVICQFFQYHLLGQICWHERTARGPAWQQPALP